MIDKMNLINQWPTTGAVLLVGSNLEETAFSYAKRILCDSLIHSNTHPDFRYIHPDPNSSWIKIDQIRGLIDWAVGTPQIATKKVAIISPAHAMNLQAANALLKTLEEPTFCTVFILISDKPEAIPATIRSRCHWIRMRSSIPSPEIFKRQEELTRDLHSLQNGEGDPLMLAARWINEKQDYKEILDCFLAVLNECVRASVKKGSFIKRLEWWQFFSTLIQARRSLEEPNQPNIQLLLETLLIQYAKRP